MWILCLAENSHEIQSLTFSEKQWKKYSTLLSAAVSIGALRVKQHEFEGSLKENVTNIKFHHCRHLISDVHTEKNINTNINP